MGFINEVMTMHETVLDRFLRYVAIDTQSSEGSDTYPSTEKQLDLLRLLADELRQLGVSDVTLDSWGYVMATLPGNMPRNNPEFKSVPVVGFIAHVDTSPSVSGANVKPQVVEYGGGDIVFNGAIFDDGQATVHENSAAAAGLIRCGAQPGWRTGAR